MAMRDGMTASLQGSRQPHATRSTGEFCGALTFGQGGGGPAAVERDGLGQRRRRALPHLVGGRLGGVAAPRRLRAQPRRQPGRPPRPRPLAARADHLRRRKPARQTRSRADALPQAILDCARVCVCVLDDGEQPG